jgi:hypothetical protein
MKAGILYLSSIPQITWHGFNELDELKKTIIGDRNLSCFCLVFVPLEYCCDIMAYDFDNKVWVQREFLLDTEERKPISRTCVSHWAYLPDAPMEFMNNTLDGALTAIDDFTIENDMNEGI